MYFTPKDAHTHTLGKKKNEDVSSFTDPDRNGIRLEAFFIPDVIFLLTFFYSLGCFYNE